MSSFNEHAIDLFSCPLCNNSVYPIYDNDLLLYNHILEWLTGTIRIRLTSKTLSKYCLILYENDIATLDKLKFKLDNNPRFLLDLGFDDYDDQFIRNFFSAAVAAAEVAKTTASVESQGKSPVLTAVNKSPITTVNKSRTTNRKKKASHSNRDRELLIRFFNENNGPGWSEQNNWCSHAPLSLWHGVSVDPRTEHVAKISLPGNNVKGMLPKYFSEIPTLSKIDLSDNHLTGELPKEWGALSALEVIYLRDNKLSGKLPPEWSTLVNLTALDLNGNELGGVFPPEWGSMAALSACILYNNYFDSDNNYIRTVLPNCRNIDAESPDSEPQGLSTIVEDDGHSEPCSPSYDHGHT